MAEEFEVVINTADSSVPLGLQLLSDEATNQQVTVHDVAPDGLAGRTGKIQVGDVIVRVNGAEHESHQAVIDALKSAKASGEVRMVLRRSNARVLRIEREPGTKLGLLLQSNRDDNDVSFTRISGAKPNTPAAKLTNLQPGDRIQAINGEPVIGLSHDEIIQKLTSALGPVLQLTVVPDDSPLAEDTGAAAAAPAAPAAAAAPAATPAAATPAAAPSNPEPAAAPVTPAAAPVTPAAAPVTPAAAPVTPAAAPAPAEAPATPSTPGNWRVAHMHKDNQALGMRLATDSGKRGVRIDSVAPGSPAQRAQVRIVFFFFFFP